MKDNTLSINEVAELLSVTRTTVNNYIKDGKLKAIKTGTSIQSAVIIKESDFKDFIQKHNKGTTWAKYFNSANESYHNDSIKEKRAKYRLGYDLKEIRELKGYEAQEIADKLNISLKKYLSYEVDTEAMGEMKAGGLIKLCKLYNIRPNDFKYLNKGYIQR